jgi:glycosyltransferase involved in cell wall biosynthesis
MITKDMIFPGKLAIQQRVLTTYRAAFFDTLARSCAQGLSVFAGLPRPEESIATTDALLVSHFYTAKNIHLFRGRFYLCYQRGLPAWLSSWDPDALIVEANPRYLSTPAAIRWMRYRNKPVIGWGLGAPGASNGGWRKSFLRQFDALLTYSRRGAEEYTALGFPADRIFVAPNATTPAPSHPMPTRRDHFAGKANLLFVGRLQARKRVDLLLRACASLPTELQPRLVIVGDGPERGALESLARSVYPEAEFSGAKHGAELKPYFLAADLFVLPGTGGLAVQEAMTYGLPVIMGAGDGTNDDLVRPGNGWQIPDNDLQALSETIRQALSDVKRLRRMGSESYRIVRDEINLEKMVGVFLEAARQVIR